MFVNVFHDENFTGNFVSKMSFIYSNMSVCDAGVPAIIVAATVALKYDEYDTQRAQ